MLKSHTSIRIIVLGFAILAITTLAFAVAVPSWSGTGSLSTARDKHTATVLANGKVLVAGGLSLKRKSGSDLR